MQQEMNKQLELRQAPQKHVLRICHYQKIRKIEWRSTFTVKDFLYLLLSTFDISAQFEIVGFKNASTGQFYTVESFCEQLMEDQWQTFSKDIF